MGFDINVDKGEFVAIMGRSGSGKSTLLNMLGGLDNPTEGEVVVDGNELSRLDEEKLAVFRRRNIGFVFQSYNLVPILNVYENIVFPIEIDNKKPDKSFVSEMASALLLTDTLKKMPNQLSGGQQQRVAIARALATKPSIVLADEPTGSLDSATSNDVVLTLKRTSELFNQTILMITHNEKVASSAGRVIYIKDGRIERRGSDD